MPSKPSLATMLACFTVASACAVTALIHGLCISSSECQMACSTSKCWLYAAASLVMFGLAMEQCASHLRMLRIVADAEACLLNQREAVEYVLYLEEAAVQAAGAKGSAAKPKLVLGSNF
ncbi:hypothetical protein BC830DRAFT_142058 [Chytriomyces sp. MP71]|nr:hypothetical protein BC830DRAFT_142058 [Chytriomyces sp. MP71]